VAEQLAFGKTKAEMEQEHNGDGPQAHFVPEVGFICVGGIDQHVISKSPVGIEEKGRQENSV
jgi:hypothetical protein